MQFPLTSYGLNRSLWLTAMPSWEVKSVLPYQLPLFVSLSGLKDNGLEQDLILHVTSKFSFFWYVCTEG